MCLHDSLFQCGFEYGGGNPAHRTLPRKVAEILVNPLQTRLVSAPAELTSFRYLMIWYSRQDMDVSHLWLKQAMREAAKWK